MPWSVLGSFVLSGVDAALAAAARGLALFPLPPGGRRPAPGWQRQCTTDPEQVARMAAAGNGGDVATER